MFKRIGLLLLGITIVLTRFGLAMIASVSVFESYQITQRLYDVPSKSFCLWRSFLHVTVGMVVMLATTIIPYQLWGRYARLLFLLTLIPLVLVFVPAFQPSGSQTSHSWLSAGPFTLQPSELLKLTMIFYLSVWLQKREQLIGTFKEGFLPDSHSVNFSRFF